jgi:hypothetical protein
MSTKPTIGRIVHVHLIAPGGPNKGRLVTRPAIVTSDNGGTTTPNVRVFFDGWNDLGDAHLLGDTVAAAEWVSSVVQLPEGEAPRERTWSWPPRV